MNKILAGMLIAAGVAAQPVLAQSIGGNYAVEGTNLDGSAYSGTAKVTLTSDTTCEIEWKTGGIVSVGICSRNDAAFAAAYVMGDVMGLVVYKVMEDGTLDGLWTIAGKPGNGTEVLVPQ